MINSTINLPKRSTRKKRMSKHPPLLTWRKHVEEIKTEKNSYPQKLKIKSFPIWFVLFSYVFLLSQNNVSNFTSYLFAYFVASRRTQKKIRICIIKHLYSGVFFTISLLFALSAFILLFVGFVFFFRVASPNVLCPKHK